MAGWVQPAVAPAQLMAGCALLRPPAAGSKRVWADDFPAVALEEFVVLVVIGRAAL